MAYILHADLNNFYASVECLYNPEIRNKPVVVVGDMEKRHGIVLAKNLYAKSLGVCTGDTVWIARQKVKQNLVCMPCRFDLYKKVSKLVKSYYYDFSDRVESFGIDEAWIDISHIVNNWEDATNVANKIRVGVLEQFGLTISVGVSWNKIFAKFGSDYKKPNAVTVITEENYKSIVWTLPVSDLLYVGHATTIKLQKCGIQTIGDLANTKRKTLQLYLGKMGEVLYDFANGLDASVVAKWKDAETIKSVGNSTTCPKDLTTFDEVKSVICVLAESVANRLKLKNLWCNTIELWIKDEGLFSFTRQTHIDYPTNLSQDILNVAFKLFEQNYSWNKTIRAVGVRACGLESKPIQYNFLKDEKTIIKKESFEKTIESLRRRWGYNIIRRANIMEYKELTDINPEETMHLIHPISYFKPKI